jgi:predicted ATPase with chaperone activity
MPRSAFPTSAPMRRRKARCRNRSPAAITGCYVARTLADRDGADKVGRVHFAEALSYRALANDARAHAA